jgi:hypothetical protein
MPQLKRLTLPFPKLINTYNAAGLGAWYAGALPHNVTLHSNSKNAAVIVFVPGLGQTAQGWWTIDDYYGKNDMYEQAFNAGFRTAFVSFTANGKRAMDMWQNGKILAWQIADICKFYKTKSVIVVAHSKGGVDTETAIVYNGAGRYVDMLITLSSPHWGSQLADLAYSSAGWHFADAINAHSDGCYVMQTEYMSEFRRKTDSNLIVVRNFKTFGGYGQGPALTKLWAGSHVLQKYGANDGVVTEQSSHNPHGTHVASLKLNHAQMRTGKYVWPYLHTIINGQPLDFSSEAVAVADELITCKSCGNIIWGGSLTNGIDEVFFVDSFTCSMQVNLSLTGQVAAKLLAPDGKEYGTNATQKLGDGQQMLEFLIEDPKPGKWKLNAAKSKGAYLVVVQFFSKSEADTINSKDLSDNIKNLKTNSKILKTYPDHYELVGEYNSNEEAAASSVKLKNGMYNVETTHTGELPDGSTYNRTSIKSMVIKPAAVDVKELLRQSKKH